MGRTTSGPRGRARQRGFTLIELMIVVTIVSVLSAIAIPSFANYVRRSKTSEAPQTLDALYKAAATYYGRQKSGQGLAAAGGKNCLLTVSTIRQPVPDPGKDKHLWPETGAPRFRALGFEPPEALYFTYQVIVTSAGATVPCHSVPTDTAEVYTFTAFGDLDGDDLESTFEIAAGVNARGELYRSAGFYILNELE